MRFSNLASQGNFAVYPLDRPKKDPGYEVGDLNELGYIRKGYFYRQHILKWGQIETGFL